MKQKLDIEKIKELETIAKELDAEKLRLSAVSGGVYILIDGLGDNLAYIIKDEKELEHWKSDGSIVKGDKLYKAFFIEQF